MKHMVFLPVTPAEARSVRSGEPLSPGHAYAATPTLRDAFGYAPDQTEEADFAAQLFASLRCLIDGQHRCVLAAEVTDLPAGMGEREFGEVARPGVRWLDVRAIFTDDPDELSESQTFAAAAHGRTLADLWEDDATHTFLERHDLLWFDPTELDQALTGLGLADSPTKGD